MLLLIVLCGILYLNGMVIRHAIHRFYNDICFYITFSATFFLLGALVIGAANMSNSWLGGLPLLMAVAAVGGMMSK